MTYMVGGSDSYISGGWDSDNEISGGWDSDNEISELK